MIVFERPQPREAAAGFTLIEMLAALAIASVVIVATAALIHDVALNFDRGANVANNTDRLLLAVERLASDFASTRLVPQTDGQTDVSVAFIGEPSQVRFIAGGGSPSGPQGEEVLGLMVEDVDGLHRLVRRRAKWPIQQGTFTGVLLQDPVRLFEGRIDIEFSYGKVAPDGKVTWSGTWTEQPNLPRLVRLTIRNQDTGVQLIPSPQFVLRADAPLACAAPGADANCLNEEKADKKPTNSEPAKASATGARG